MKKYLIIKLGGSVITAKKTGEMTINEILADNLLNIIAQHCNQFNLPILLCHGAGSFGHNKAKQFLSLVADLNSEQIKNWLRQIHNDVKILNEFIDEKARKKIKQELILDIIHGDVNFEGPNYIISTEDQILIKSALLKKQGYFPDKIILLTDTDGLLDLNGKTIETVDDNYFALNAEIFIDNNDATGGMKQKIEKSLELKKIASESEVVILNGKNPKNLSFELKGDKTIGTRVR